MLPAPSRTSSPEPPHASASTRHPPPPSIHRTLSPCHLLTIRHLPSWLRSRRQASTLASPPPPEGLRDSRQLPCLASASREPLRGQSALPLRPPRPRLVELVAQRVSPFLPDSSTPVSDASSCTGISGPCRAAGRVTTRIPSRLRRPGPTEPLLPCCAPCEFATPLLSSGLLTLDDRLPRHCRPSRSQTPWLHHSTRTPFSLADARFSAAGAPSRQPPSRLPAHYCKRCPNKDGTPLPSNPDRRVGRRAALASVHAPQRRAGFGPTNERMRLSCPLRRKSCAHHPASSLPA